jgi:hypothetical protein
MVYGIQFSENNFTVATKSNFFVNEDVNFVGRPISSQLSYRLIKHILSIEFGPIVQVGGKFKSEYDKTLFQEPLLLRIFRIFQNLTSIQPLGNCRGKTFSF